VGLIRGTDEIDVDTLLDEMLDPLAGVCQRLVDIRESVSDSVRFRMGSFEVFGAAFANPAFPLYPEVAYHDWAYGSGRGRVNARQRAVFETIERFCVLSPPTFPPAFVGSYFDAPSQALDPAMFWQYAPWQQDSNRRHLGDVSAEDQVSWYAGESASREAILVPAPYAFVNLPPDQMVSDLTTSGTAVYSERSEAQLRALLEAIERDVTMRHWCRGEPVPHIVIDSLPAGLRVAVEDIVRQGYEVCLLDVPTTVPASVIIAAARTRDGHPARVVCSVAELTTSRAIARAVRELAAALILAWAFTERDGDTRMTAEQVVDPEDHARYYRHPDNAAVLDFFFTPSATTTLTEVPTGDRISGLTALTEALDAQGMPTVFLDLGSAFTRRRGLHVVRAVVPQLFPLTFGIGYLRFGGRADLVILSLPTLGATPIPIHDDVVDRLKSVARRP